MKKIIAGTIVGCALLVSGTFASDVEMTKISSSLIDSDITLIDSPMLISENSGLRSEIVDLIKKNELIIRNNNLEADYKYNNVNYFTSKIKSEDIIVPKEISDKAKKIYFLVEEGSSRIFNFEGMMAKDNIEFDIVKKEYNYKIIDFKSGQVEYIFNNKDLVKNFGDNEYRNVTITLMADFSDTEKVPLSDTVYLSINNKESILANLKNEQNKDNSYFGYYNTDDLEIYLENFSSKISRSDYKKLLSKMDSKIISTNKANEKNLEEILKSITKESDFNKYVDKYTIYIETNNLFNNLSSAVKNQLQNIRAYEAIDSLIK